MSRPRTRIRSVALIAAAVLMMPLMAVAGEPAPAEAVTVTGSCQTPLDLGTTKENGALVGVPIDVDQSRARLSGVPELRELRGILWDRNPPFVPWGQSSSMKLRDAAKRHGITTRDQYVNAIQWDQHLDFMAMERLAESTYIFPEIRHQRTNGSSIYTLSRNGYGLDGENLQWNGMDHSVGPIIEGAIEWWGLREYDYLVSAGGVFTSANGHLHTLMDPSHTGVAFAVNEDNGLSVALVSKRSAVSGQSSVTGDRVVTVGVDSSQIYASAPVLVAVGASIPSVLEAHGINASCVSGAFSSQHPSVATVSADGVVTGKKWGSTTITFRTGTETIRFPIAVKPGSQVSGNGFAFTDVSFTQPFMTEIAWLAQRGHTTGFGWGDSREYRPASSINRDAMAAFLYRLAGSPAYTPPKESPFTDVPTTRAFYKEIAWLAEQDISSGWRVDGGAEFRPLASVNRDAMAAFMYRFAGSPSYTPPASSPFTDVRTTRPFYTQIAWLAETGISTGWQSGSKAAFRPFGQVNRDAMAAFVYRLDQL